MTEMSVSMVLNMVDRLSPGIKKIQDELTQLKAASSVLKDVNAGTPSRQWEEASRVLKLAVRLYRLPIFDFISVCAELAAWRGAGLRIEHWHSADTRR